MPKKSIKSNKTSRRNKPKLSFWSRWSRNQKMLSIFVLAFALVGGTLIFKSFAAVGDELQAKNNSTWSGSFAKRIIMAPDGSYGYTLDVFGAIHPLHTYGAQPSKPTGGPYFPGHDIARDIVVTKWDKTNSQGYVLDGFGGIHAFGGAQAPSGGPYWSGWDIARRIVIQGTGGYVLDGLGGLHPFKIGSSGTAPPAVKQGPYWAGQDVARDVEIRSDGKVGMVLDCHGGITPVGFGITGAPGYPNGYPYNGSKCEDLAKFGADYRSFGEIEWSKPSGVVINSRGEFAGFGTRGVAAFIAPGLGTVVDGTCKFVTAQNTSRCWALDDHGNIRAFSSPNKPLFTDSEIAYFKSIEFITCTRQNFRLGSNGACVKVLQDKLNYLVGNRLSSDGVFGAATDLVVTAYQCGNGLVGDGIVGPKTWDAIANNKRGIGPCPEIKTNFSISIVGDANCIKDTQIALTLLKNNAPTHYSRAISNISTIKCAAIGSGINASDPHPVFTVGDQSRNAGAIWYAGIIAHDSEHVQLYREYAFSHPGQTVPPDIYSGKNGESICVIVQVDALKKIGADQQTIDYVIASLSSNYWHVPYDQRTW